MPSATGRGSATARTSATGRASRPVATGTAPAAPSSLTATNVSSSQVNLSWTRNATDETSVRIERAPDSSGSPGTFAEITSVGVGVTTYSDTVLSASTRFWYRVRNRNSFGDSSYSNNDDATTDAASSWADSGALTNVTLGALDLRPKHNTGMIAIDYTVTSGASIVSATVDYRTASGPGSALPAQPLWGFTDYNSQKRMAGSINGWSPTVPSTGLAPNTAYDVRVAFTDNTAHVQVKVGTFTTWAEDISTPAALVATATRFVDTINGNDSWTGTSATFVSGTTGPWKTLDKARATAAAGAVVQVAPGWYQAPSTYHITAINYVAQYPAIVNDTTRAVEADTSKHAVVYSGVQISPTGTTAQNAGKTLNGGADYMPSTTWSGPLTNSGGHTYYKATGVNNGSNMDLLSFHTNRLDSPIAKVAAWLATSADYSTVDQWVNVVYTNQDWNSGFIKNGTDLYMVPPVEMVSAPTAYWWTMEANGSGRDFMGFGIIASNSRICGFRFREILDPVITANTGSLGNGGTNYVIDHCYIDSCGACLFEGYASGTRSSKHIFQYNRVQMYNLASLTDPTKVISWWAIKSHLHLAGDPPLPTDGTGTYRTLAANEQSPFTAYIYATDITIRNNSFYGAFNGAFMGNQTQTPQTGFGPWDAASNYDVNDNYMEAVGDDAFEPEGYGCNLRVWNNRVVGTPQGISMAPIYYGPLIFHHNTIYRIDPVVANLPTNGASGVFKITAQPTVAYRALVICAHNTFWADPSVGTRSVSFHALAGGGLDGNYWLLRNNIIRIAKRYMFQMTGPLVQWDEDYNLFGTTDNTPAQGMVITASSYMDMPSYRTGTGSGIHSNKDTGGTDLDPTGTGAGTAVTVIDGTVLTAVSTALGDMTLKAGTNPAVDAGIVLADLTGPYNGAAPDLGAIER